MGKRKRLPNADGELREPAGADFARATHRKLRRVGERGPQKAPTKKLVSLRLSAEVLEHYKATGAGWQTRIDEMLKRTVARAGR